MERTLTEYLGSHAPVLKVQSVTRDELMLLVWVQKRLVDAVSHVRARTAGSATSYATSGACSLSFRLGEVPYSFCALDLARDASALGERAEQLEQLLPSAFPPDALANGHAWVFGNVHGNGEATFDGSPRGKLSRPGSPDANVHTVGSVHSDASSWVLWDEDEYTTGALRLVSGFEGFAEPRRRFQAAPDRIFALYPGRCADYRAEEAVPVFAGAPVFALFRPEAAVKDPSVHMDIDVGDGDGRRDREDGLPGDETTTAEEGSGGSRTGSAHAMDSPSRENGCPSVASSGSPPHHAEDVVLLSDFAIFDTPSSPAGATELTELSRRGDHWESPLSAPREAERERGASGDTVPGWSPTLGPAEPPAAEPGAHLQADWSPSLGPPAVPLGPAEPDWSPSLGPTEPEGPMRFPGTEPMPFLDDSGSG